MTAGLIAVQSRREAVLHINIYYLYTWGVLLVRIVLMMVSFYCHGIMIMFAIRSQIDVRQIPKNYEQAQNGDHYVRTKKRNTMLYVPVPIVPQTKQFDAHTHTF